MIAQFGTDVGLRVYRGSEDDVLGRLVGAAREAAADVVVRVTGDCPLIDPAVVDRVVDELVEQPFRCDYASNVLRRTYPRGLDTEALFMDTLLRVDRLATSNEDREHVTLAIRSTYPNLFLTRSIEDTANNSDLRWTVDEPPDLDLIRALFEQLELGSTVLPYQAIVRFVRQHPELQSMNAGVETWSPPTATA